MVFLYCSNKYRFSGHYYTCTPSTVVEYLEAVVRDDDRAKLQQKVVIYACYAFFFT